MRSNGGYLILDFKNASLSGHPFIINGLYSQVAKNIKKPIIITNINSIEGAQILGCIYVNKITFGDNQYRLSFGSYRVDIEANDSVTAVSASNLNTLSVESEVSTNASKSDSSISK